MAAGAAEADLRSWRKTQHPNGTDTELLTIPRVAKLFVLCGDGFASKQIQAGDLSVRVVRCTGDAVSMVTCKVGDHQWLLAKDSTAVRIGRRSFFFVLPGMLYGLVLPAFGPPDHRYDMLEEIFESFSAYVNITSVRGSDPTSSEPYDWSRSYSPLPQHDSRGNAMVAAASSSPPRTAATIGTARMQKATRMSAAVKLISRSLLNGTLRPSDHLHVSVTADVDRAYPTMAILANLFDAFELGMPPANIIAGRAPPESFWGFKEEGLALLFELVKYGGTRKRPRVDVDDANAGAKVDKEVEKSVDTTAKQGRP